MPVSRWPMARSAPGHGIEDIEGVDLAEWGALIERGHQQGSIHAEQVTHVLRDVELTGDVLDRVQVVWTTRGSPSTRRSTPTPRPEPDDATAELARAPRPGPHGGGGRAPADPPPAPAHPSVGARTEGTTSDGVRMYLREIGQVDLLTGDDERRLAQLIEAGHLAAARIDEAATTGPPVDDVEIRRLVRARPARRAGQERAHPGQPAARREHRQAVLGPGDAAARPDPGGQPRADAGRRQVRPLQGVQVLDVRHVVDPPGHHPLDRRPGPHDPHPGAHGRAHEPGDPGQASAAPGAGARADDRRAGRAGAARAGAGA